nr:Ribosomal protein L13 [uncultured marine group II/III euryarchaeote KM3_89_F04]
MPHLMFKRSVRGMIPYQTPRGRAAFKRLRVDIGPAGAEKPETIERAQMTSGTVHVTLGDVSRKLGAKF